MIRIRIIVICTVLLAVPLLAVAEDAQRVELTPHATQETSIPAFSFAGAGRCDDRGNLYFLVDLGNEPAHVLRISPDEGGTAFRFPETTLAGGRVAFHLDPATQRVWVVRQTDSEFEVLAFDERGAAQRVTLDAPKHLVLWDFAVTKNDAFFVHGYFNNSAAEQNHWATWAGIFDHSGRLVRKVEAISNAKLGLDGASRRRDKGVTVGADGNLYVAFAPLGAIVAISPQGTHLRNLPIRRPAESAIVSDLEAAGENLVLHLLVPRETGGYGSTFAVMDTGSGAIRQFVEPVSGLGGVACMRGTYTFVRRGDDNNLHIIMAGSVQ